jgi:hypothetical protein
VELGGEYTWRGEPGENKTAVHVMLLYAHHLLSDSFIIVTLKVVTLEFHSKPGS